PRRTVDHAADRLRLTGGDEHGEGLVTDGHRRDAVAGGRGSLLGTRAAPGRRTERRQRATCGRHVDIRGDLAGAEPGGCFVAGGEPVGLLDDGVGGATAVGDVAERRSPADPDRAVATRGGPGGWE